MQKVVGNLTLMLNERDDEIVALQSMNRELGNKVKEFTIGRFGGLYDE